MLTFLSTFCIKKKSADFSASSEPGLTYQFPLCLLYILLNFKNVQLDNSANFRLNPGIFSTSAHFLLIQHLDIKFCFRAYFLSQKFKIEYKCDNKFLEILSIHKLVHLLISTKLIQKLEFFPIQIVVWVGIRSLDRKQIDTKWKEARLMNKFLSFETGILKPSNFSNRVSRIVCSFFA